MTKSSSPTAPPPTLTPAVRPARFAGLDGLRALAVILVMLFHLTPGFVPGGYLGVDVFFVLSGFLITSLLVREATGHGRIRLGNFWRRRARRLLPALALLVVVCCTAAWAIGGDVLLGIGKQVSGAASFSSNWLAVASGHSYFDDTVPELFRNLWSLAVEEQFYLLWPLIVILVLLVRSARLRVALVAVAAIGSAVLMSWLYVPGADATRVYYGTDTHSFGLTLGAVLALLNRHWMPSALVRSPRLRGVFQWLGTAAVAGLIAAAFLMPADAPFAYRGGLAIVAVLTALAIAGSIVPGCRLGAALDSRPLKWIGERSYGLYLWHWPVFVLVLSALPAWPRSGATGWGIGGIALAIAAVLASLSYRFVEQPIRKTGFRATWHLAVSGLRSSRLKLAGMSAAALLLAGGSLTTAAAIADDPGVGEAQLDIQRGQAAIATPEPTPVPTPLPTPAPAASTAPAAGPEITAIGDSVMLASAPELQAAFPGIQIDAVVSRQAAEAPQLLGSLLAQGTLRHTVLLGLGTNGPIDAAVLAQVRAIARPPRQIVVVNVQAPRSWTSQVNDALSRFAAQYRDVELADWRDAIAGHLELLASDHIHPGARGGLIYVSAVRDALQRLADLPPLPPRRFGFITTPVPPGIPVEN